MSNGKVVVLPRDEEAIEKARKDSGWRMWRHTFEDGTPRPRHMSLPEDNYDYGQYQTND